MTGEDQAFRRYVSKSTKALVARDLAQKQCAETTSLHGPACSGQNCTRTYQAEFETLYYGDRMMLNPAAARLYIEHERRHKSTEGLHPGWYVGAKHQSLPGHSSGWDYRFV
jgi:hypothetical protein